MHHPATEGDHGHAPPIDEPPPAPGDLAQYFKATQSRMELRLFDAATVSIAASSPEHPGGLIGLVIELTGALNQTKTSGPWTLALTSQGTLPKLARRSQRPQARRPRRARREREAHRHPGRRAPDRLLRRDARRARRPPGRGRADQRPPRRAVGEGRQGPARDHPRRRGRLPRTRASRGASGRLRGGNQPLERPRVRDQRRRRAASTRRSPATSRCPRGASPPGSARSLARLPSTSTASA